MVQLLKVFYLAILFSASSLISGAPNIQEKLLITTPPTAQTAHCANANLLRRQKCSYGQCGTECLSQGAFCCGPAGTLATSPYWVCDNGACITSVRGTTGVVDCFDPDNASGTTQSCIDLSATSTCNPTDRCFTCDSEAPWCRWETYIAPNSPTLRWFSCVETRLPDTTFLAATITAHPSNTLHTSSHTSIRSTLSSQPTTFSTTTQTPTNSSSNAHGEALSTGAIIGISIGGGIAVAGSVAIIAYCCLRKRKAATPPPPELATTEQPTVQQDPIEIADSRQYTHSELNSTTAYSPRSQPATPFTASEGYNRNIAEVDRWRDGTAHKTSDFPDKINYVAQSPRELPADHADVRDSWGRGDDRQHMSPHAQ
ncbi:hypothetical protein BDV96DRAFT_303591 [Lophiotrema nucula]|uniref:Mid2 domain-containing protein n=1 Tax=Lophiotrema nucula TaxID=690887 RepID=A0A6A5YJK8_9PLEO|nr:hypothetical protein BDV96DRAFT_303591 [Lophiotrema nucula]